MKKTTKFSAASLRQKAEEMLNKKNLKDSTQLSETEAMKLINELEVHQIELELINEELKLANEKANAASDKYAELYDFAPSGYFSLSHEGEITALNLSGASMLGKERSHLINKRFDIFVSRDTKPILNLFFEKIFNSKTKETCEVTLIANGILRRYIHLSGIVIENGEQCLVTAVDITERKQMEEDLHRANVFLDSIVENIPNMIFIKDARSLRFVRFNRAGEDLLGILRGELLGKNDNDFFSEEHAGFFIEKDKEVLLNKKMVDIPEEPIQTKHQGIRILHTKKVPLLNALGEPEYLLGISEDITERKLADTELIKAKERAEESDRLKSAFLANMSHEIRTPMNGILGFAELLKEPELSGEQQARYISIIEKSGIRMLSAINDIIDFSKIEAGLMEVTMSETSINSQFDDIYSFFKPEAEARGLKLTFNKSLPDDEVNISTDAEKLYAILTNLVKNAIKYTTRGSIEFGYKIVETLHATFLQFYVKDTGIGIPKDRQEAVFDRFIQADISDKQAYQGSGLGLTISKAYVEMLGGKIWVESHEENPETGKMGSTTFYFTIPVSRMQVQMETIKNQNKEHEYDDEPAYKGPGLKVLIVEDEEVSNLMLAILIRDISREILFAKTGFEAIDVCRNNPDLDLVLMDIKMPGLNGYEATRQIRSFNKDIIIIAQTAYALLGDKEKTLEAGCNDYITKPLSKKVLFEKIKRIGLM